MYRKPNVVTTRILELAGHLVRMSDGRTVKNLWGNQTEQEKQEDRN